MTSPTQVSLDKSSKRNSVALITAGGQNLDDELLHSLAHRMTAIAIHYHDAETHDDAVELSHQLRSQDANVVISMHSGDLRTTGAVESLFHDVVGRHHGLDIVVNSTGMVMRKPLDEDRQAAEYNSMLAYAVFVDEQRRKCVDRYLAAARGMEMSLS